MAGINEIFDRLLKDLGRPSLGGGPGLDYDVVGPHGPSRATQSVSRRLRRDEEAMLRYI
jgi:hypothetical protein